jgi:hypothetical protein
MANHCDMRAILFLTVSIVFLTGCSRHFIASDFSQKTRNHKTIAVLPVHMIFTGTPPRNVSASDIALLEEAESKAFMITLYNEILRSNKGGKKPIMVDMQAFTRTINILEERNLGIRDTWTMDPQELARILGVDAVVQARVTKKRYMSNLASYGIDLGIDLLDRLLKGRLAEFVPMQVSRTDDIFASFSLVNGEDASVLYSSSYTVEADWNAPPEVIIENVTRKFARNFPYRK